MTAVGVGIVGTGFVARKRAEALAQDGRGQVVAVADHVVANSQGFAQQYQTQALPTWQDLVIHPQVDLVMVCQINCHHGAVVAAALAAQKHVVVEYPLALTVTEAERLLTLAQVRDRLLHVEHIELLGGTHQALKTHLTTLGQIHYARYSTLAPKRRVPRSWSYCPQQFGFPLVGALSRLHRLIDAFGPVQQVYGQNHYGGLTQADDRLDYYTTCLCTAQLTFTSGLVGSVVYGKGEGFWTPTRRLEVYGSQGQLVLDGDGGEWVDAQGLRSLSLGSRRGLFAADTTAVLDHLLADKPLYCTPAASVYSLRVATAVQQSAASGQSVTVAA